MSTVEKDFRQYRSNIAKLPERYDIEREAWHAAAKKYQERIEELETRLHFSELAYKGAEDRREKLESEKAKLKKSMEEIANGHLCEKVSEMVARQCLKELQIGAT